MKPIDPKELQTHPTLSALFVIDPQVLDAVMQDMQDKGFVDAHPIEVGVWPGQDAPVVIDGHTRLQAALSLGLETVPVVGKAYQSEQQALAYAVHNQKNRRNLAANDASLLRAVQLLDNAPPMGSNQFDGSQDGTTTAKQTADALGVSERTVRRARKVLKDKQATQAVLNGDKTIHAATEQAQAQDVHARADGSAQVVIPSNLVRKLQVYGNVQDLVVRLLIEAVEVLDAQAPQTIPVETPPAEQDVGVPITAAPPAPTEQKTSPPATPTPAPARSGLAALLDI